MNIETIIDENINQCIENTKKYINKNNKNIFRNINKAINGIYIINNIKYTYYLSPLNNDKNLYKINNRFSYNNLNQYFNRFYIWFLFPEKEVNIIIPIIKLNIVEPAFIWDDNANMTSPEKIELDIYNPEINLVVKSSQIVILKTPLDSIFINDTNTSLESLINNYSINEYSIT